MNKSVLRFTLDKGVKDTLRIFGTFFVEKKEE